MIEQEQKLLIAKSYLQIEHSLAFTDFTTWVREETEAAESALLMLTPDRVDLYQPYFLRWQTWKTVSTSINRHISLSKEVLKEISDAGDPDSSALNPISPTRDFYPGY